MAGASAAAPKGSVTDSVSTGDRRSSSRSFNLEEARLRRVMKYNLALHTPTTPSLKATTELEISLSHTASDEINVRSLPSFHRVIGGVCPNQTRVSHTLTYDI